MKCASSQRISVSLAILLLAQISVPASPQLQTLPGHVPKATAHSQATGRLEKDRRLDLALGLPWRNQDALTNLLQSLYNPASPQYHRFLTPQQFADRFAPTEEDYRAVIAWAKKNGLAITGTHPNRMLLDVNASVAEIEKCFHVELRLYPHPSEARAFYAPDTEPSVDPPVPLAGVSGLDDFFLARPMNLRRFSADKPLEPGSAARPYAAGSGPRGAYIGRDFRRAYAPGVSWDGAGEAVGLFELDGYYASDITAYENLAGLPDVPLTNVLVNGFSGRPRFNNLEVALDIEMVLAMAPGLSRVIVYEGTVPNSILNGMATDNQARQLSCSWGFGDPTDSVRQQIFQQFAAQGQSFFQASGDVGGYPAAIYPPSDDPLVTSVGGTALTTAKPGGAWLSETVWPGSGGGISTVYPIPAWQQGIDMAQNGGSTAMRNVPDVACLADEAIWVVANNGDHGVTGGTSASAPLWAAFTALVNQAGAALGRPPVGFLNPALYALGKSAKYETAFHDIVTGNNTNDASPSRFFASPGYDLCTGWGTPKGLSFINALLAPAPALEISPGPTRVFSGPAGGSFAPDIWVYTLTNTGSARLHWQLDRNASWLVAVPAAGTLVPGGPATTVTVRLTGQAKRLLPGSYSETLSFTTRTDQSIQARQVGLDVAAPPMTATDFTLETLYSFKGGADGAYPNGLLQDGTGAFYGTAQSGGSNGLGTVFAWTPGHAPAGLYSFAGGHDGANPFAGLTKGLDGSFYGTTVQGGDDDNGTVFQIGADGTFATLFPLTVAAGDLPHAGLTLGADGSFYGMGYQGGQYGRGTIFAISTGGGLARLYSFSNGADGGHPAGELVQANDGSLYGTTYKGGAYGCGTVFNVNARRVLTTLTAFNQTNGAFPHAGLILGDDRSLYGTTVGGGSGYGTIFRITPDGELTNLYSFSGGDDGANPTARLLLADDGNFYGTTSAGGAKGCGTLFSATPSGAFTTLVQFDGYHGADPESALAQGKDGHLYGATRAGGAGGLGTLFRLSVNPSPPRIVSQPATQLVYAGAEVEFSVAVYGSLPLYYQWRKDGSDLVDAGNVLGAGSRALRLANVSATNVGVYSVLVSNAVGSVASAETFLQVTSSAPVVLQQPGDVTLLPGARITLRVAALGDLPLRYQWLKDGTNLFDTADRFGASESSLTILKATEANNGLYTVVVTNMLGSVTSAPAKVLILPPSAPGTAFATVWAFSGGGDGSIPNDLVQGHDGLFYGTTQLGGPNLLGTVFRLATNGVLTPLAAFRGANGSIPQAGLLEAADGDFYGTTSDGGPFEAGTVFKITPTGSLTTISPLTGGADGANPAAALVAGPDGLYYGTTPNGGSNGFGSIFSVSAEGALSSLYSFANGTDGGTPAGGLIPGRDGLLYGLAAGGGAYGHGTAFRIDAQGKLSTVYAFRGDTDGSEPVGSLVQGADGNFYGATRLNFIAGYQFYGTVFKLTPGGALTTLYSFNPHVQAGEGAYPAAGLIEGRDGNFYGTTYEGGTTGNGTVYRLSPDGTLSTLMQFDGFNSGAHPQAALVEGADGSLYGSTSTGGPGSGGTIFRLSATGAPQITAHPSPQHVAVSATVVLSVAAFGSPVLSFQWQKNGTNLVDGVNLSGSRTRLLAITNAMVGDSGTYSVTVSNLLGSVASAGALLIVSEPPALRAATSNGILALTWSSTAGRRYRVQYRTNLSATNWNSLGGTVTAGGSAMTANDAIGTNTQRFYRVVLLP